MDRFTPVFPQNRLGPEGGVFKVGVPTCHNGVQPLYGVSMLQEFMNKLSQKTNEAVPNFETYEPGVTQTMAPEQTSALEPVKLDTTELAAQ